ncbi:hypothetical protein DSECCO2_589790 [anaerobic digester metagenome]
MIRTPYFRADRTASATTVSSASARMQTMPAPDFAAISTSMAPVSAIFMSATISRPGKRSRSVRTARMPSLLIRGVPASIQSAPPRTASSAISTARSSSRRSSATWRTGVAILYCRAENVFIWCRAGGNLYAVR